MSHWAELDKDNFVIRVLVGDNNDPNGDEGYSWLIKNLGGRWVRTSYNARQNGFRKNFAGIGSYYDEDMDAFLNPKPYPSWILDRETYQWMPPVPHPEEYKTYDNRYYWNEETLSWIDRRTEVSDQD